MAERFRLDIVLEQRGLVQSRARARDAILRGTVRVNGEPASKPSQMVSDADRVDIDDPAGAYVSRAALKLIAGLDAGKVDVTGATCLDLGASTGGFTQVLAERGAARIYAIDVGHDQLHPRIASLPQVISREGTNAADLTSADIPEPVDVLVCDVSFVSVIKILSAPLRLCKPGATAVILIKPQFEVGRAAIGKNGIVTNLAAVDAAIAAVIAFVEAEGWALIGQIASPIAGQDGNKETVALFRRTG